MILKTIISNWLERRKRKEYEEVEKILAQIIENYQKKLALMDDFYKGKINETDFKTEFLKLLNIEFNLQILEESVSHDTIIQKEILDLKNNLTYQADMIKNKAYMSLSIQLKKESEILSIEQKQIKELEDKLLPKNTKEQIEENIIELGNLEFPVRENYELALLLAINWDLTQELMRKTKPGEIRALFEYGIPAVKDLIKTREDLSLIVELAGKTVQAHVSILLENNIVPIKRIIKTREDLTLLVELAGKIKPERVMELFLYGIPAVKHLIENKEDLKAVVLVLIELDKKTNPKIFHYLFKESIPDLQYLINNKEDLKEIGLELIELAERTKPENDGYYLLGDGISTAKDLIASKEDLTLFVNLAKKTRQDQIYELFKYAIPAAGTKEEAQTIAIFLLQFAEQIGPEHMYSFYRALTFFRHLFKTRDDIKRIVLFLLELRSKLKYQDFSALLQYGFSDIKNTVKKIEDLDKINSMLPELIIKSHRLYREQKEQEFFKPERTIVRRQFAKSGSETILLGGKQAGKTIIRIVSEEAFFAWKKAFEAKDAWQKAGFDYIPVEPILMKNKELRAYKTKDGKYRVYTKVLGMSVFYFIQNTSDKELIKQILTTRAKIIKVLTKDLQIVHGHLHKNNFCVEAQDDKIRLYVIDFDMAISS